MKIGKQIWMAENLKSSKLNDGTSILEITDQNIWRAINEPVYSYQSDDINGDKYSCHYNWYTVNTGKFCPYGWHVPTDNDWKIIEKSLGMTQSQADALFNIYSDTILVRNTIHGGPSEKVGLLATDKIN